MEADLGCGGFSGQAVLRDDFDNMRAFLIDGRPGEVVVRVEAADYVCGGVGGVSIETIFKRARLSTRNCSGPRDWRTDLVLAGCRRCERYSNSGEAGIAESSESCEY